MAQADPHGAGPEPGRVHVPRVSPYRCRVEGERGGDLRSSAGTDAGPFTAGVWLAMALALLAVAATVVVLSVWRMTQGRWLPAAVTLLQACLFVGWGVVLLRRWRRTRDAGGSSRRP